eukprot:47959-Eustigmatos_ZCMA.PRE.1
MLLDDYFCVELDFYHFYLCWTAMSFTLAQQASEATAPSDPDRRVITVSGTDFVLDHRYDSI